MSRAATFSFASLAVAMMAVTPGFSRAQASTEAGGSTRGVTQAGAAADTKSGESPSIIPGTSFGAWAGFAHRSPSGLWGTTPGRDLSLFAVRLAWTIYQDPGVAVDYTVDFVPVASLSRERLDVPPTECPKGVICPLYQTVSTGASHGFGMAPAGVELRFRPTHMIQPFIGGNVGMLHFSERVPSPRGSRVNFTANLGGGVQVRMPDDFAVVFGYKLFHLSNAGHAISNPGVDNNLVYVGIVRR